MSVDGMNLSVAKIALGHLGLRHEVNVAAEGATVVVTPHRTLSAEVVDRITLALKGDGITVEVKNPAPQTTEEPSA